MTRVRVALVLGFALLVLACALPCYAWLALSGASLPYQDAPPELLKKQAAEVAAANRELATRLWISAGVVLVALATIGYAGWSWLAKRRPAEPP